MATIEELQAQIVSLGDQLRDISGYIEDPTLLKEENSQIQSYLADFTTKEGILLTIASLFSFLSFSDNNMFSHFLILTLPFLIFAIVFYILSTKRCSCIMSKKFDSFDFSTQKPVALQLNCLFIISSFRSSPASKKRSITL